MTILEQLKQRPDKRAGLEEVGGLLKKMKGVHLNGLQG